MFLRLHLSLFIIILRHITYNLYDIAIPFQITIHSPSTKESNKGIFFFFFYIKSIGNDIYIINQLLVMYLKIIR
jgi:hypothetical protein